MGSAMDWIACNYRLNAVLTRAPRGLVSQPDDLNADWKNDRLEWMPNLNK